jgi:hypothetical protein
VPALGVQTHQCEPAEPAQDEGQKKNLVPQGLAMLMQRLQPGGEQGGIAPHQPDTETNAAEHENRHEGPALDPTPVAGGNEQQHAHHREPETGLQV